MSQDLVQLREAGAASGKDPAAVVQLVERCMAENADNVDAQVLACETLLGADVNANAVCELWAGKLHDSRGQSMPALLTALTKYPEHRQLSLQGMSLLARLSGGDDSCEQALVDTGFVAVLGSALTSDHEVSCHAAEALRNLAGSEIRNAGTLVPGAVSALISAMAATLLVAGNRTTLRGAHVCT